MTAPSSAAYLLVRAGGREVGLPLESLIEVIDPPAPLPVPTRDPAIRGVVPFRGRLVPLVHLGTLLAGGEAAATGPLGGAAILVRAGGLQFALEVDVADTVAHDAVRPLPADSALPWAAAIAPRPDGPVPLLDLGAIASRLAESPA